MGLIALSLSSLLHILLVLIFIKWLDLGYTGVCIATLLMFIARFGITLLHTERAIALKNIYGVSLFSKESTQGVTDQLSLGFYGLLMGVWSWWAFDLYTLVASYTSVGELSA